MAKTAAKKRSRSKKKGDTTAFGPDISAVRLELRGWYLRTLHVDTSGEYNKLHRTIEFFLLQAERQLNSVLWDRATEIALQEALRHLVVRWGPKFQGDLHLEIRVSDTHLKFSLTVPADAIIRKKKGTVTSKMKAQRDTAADKCLYVVRCLVDRLQKSPAGRQLVFWRLLRHLPRY